MSAKKPGAGTRVSGGRLRVDAARAIDKLRSYQLADPTGWVLEVVRAGVGLSAIAIGVEGSASDVFVAIACEPPPDASLLRIFEELVDPSPDAAARPLRLLGIGLNAALGGPTRFADVYAIDEKGSRRVRFTPEVFTTDGDGAHDIARGMRALTVEPAAFPAFAPRPERGLVVHVRAKVALAVISRWATGELPRELALVNDAATEVTVPISVNGLPVPRDPTILLREPLPDGGYVALVTPRAGSVRATLEAAELGVVLSREPWQLAIKDQDAPVPLVLRIDRARLPTNAARSAVRWDEPALELALTQGNEALARLVTKLCAELETGRDPARRSWLRLVGLMLLASETRGASFRQKLRASEVSAPFLPLLDAPLLLDATGRTRSVTSIENVSSPKAEVHYGDVFASSSLAPWIGDVLAAPPGDPTHLLFGELPPSGAEDLMVSAQHALEIRERWLALPVAPPIVEPRTGGLVRVPLESPEPASGPKRRGKAAKPRLESVEGLRGEVVLGAGDGGRVVELRLDGRTIERVRAISTVSIRAVAEHPRFVPSAELDHVTDTSERRDVLAAVDRALFVGCEAVAAALAGEPAVEGEVAEWIVPREEARTDPRAPALVREGVLSAVAENANHAADRVAKSALDGAPAWPTHDGTMVSLAALRAEPSIGSIPQATSYPLVLPRGRVVLAVSNAERGALRQVLPHARFVDYGRSGTSALTASAITAEQLGACSVGIGFDHGDHRGFAGWGVERSELKLSHVGIGLGSRECPTGAVPTRVRVDDDLLVPGDGWDLLAIDRNGGTDVYSPAKLSIEIARQIVRAWLGARPATLVSTIRLETSSIVRAVLREARHELVPAAECEPLRRRPLFPVFGREAEASFEEVLSHGTKIPFVPPTAIPQQEERDAGVFALKLERIEAEGLASLFGVRASAVDETSALKEALRTRRRDERMARIRRAAPVDVSVPGAHPVVSMAGMGILEGLLGYAPHVRDGRVRVLVEGRPFSVLTGDAGLPPYIEGVVSVDESLLREDVDAVSETGRARIRGAALSAARTLLPRALATRGTALFTDATIVGLAMALVDRKKRKGEPGAMIDALFAIPSLTTVQGTTISIADAMTDRELRFVTDEIAWVGPLEGEPVDALDGPIVIVPWTEDQPARTLLDRLVDGALRDVTAPLRRLVTKRRAERGLGARPTLPADHVRSLARTIEELAQSSSKRDLILEVLGIGSIALSQATPSRVTFFVDGDRVLEEKVDFVPSFHAAVESPLVARKRTKLTSDGRDRMHEAVAALLAELLRTLADARAFDGAPSWALDAQRDAALLGGREHLDRLEDVPLFETTEGTRASPAAVGAQAARFLNVWWTDDLTSTLLPLDPERLVLRLPPITAERLGKHVVLRAANEELALDQIARANRDRPPVASIAPTDEERASPFGAVSWTEDGREHVVIPLLPFDAARSKMTLYREGRKLAEVEVPGELPAIVRVEAPELRPNRMWDGVVRDAEVQRIERVVARAIERAVLEELPPAGPGTAALSVDATVMEPIPHGNRVVRGTLWLGPLDARVCAGVRVLDVADESFDEAPPELLSSTPPKREPVAIPLEGTLVLWGALRETGAGTLDAVGRHLYQRLLSRTGWQISKGKSADVDLDLAQLVRGAALGFLPKDLTHMVKFGVTDIGTIADIATLFEGDGPVIAIEPGEVERATSLRATLARPVFVVDGSLAAAQLRLLLGDRVRTLSEALAESLEITEEADEPSSPEVEVSVEAEADAPRANEKKKSKKEKKKKEKASSKPPPRPPSAPPPRPMPTRAGPVEPLAVALTATLKRLGSTARAEVDPIRSAPMISWEEGAVSLAGTDAHLRAIAGTAAGRDRASLLLAAHALSMQGDREAALRALHTLLE